MCGSEQGKPVPYATMEDLRNVPPACCSDPPCVKAPGKTVTTPAKTDTTPGASHEAASASNNPHGMRDVYSCDGRSLFFFFVCFFFFIIEMVLVDRPCAMGV